MNSDTATTGLTDAALEQLRKDRRWSALATAAGIPFNYRHVSFETVRPTLAVQAAQKVAYDDFDYSCRAVMLEGAVGVGKSTAARSLQRYRLIENDGGISVVAFFNFPELSRRLLDREQFAATMAACREADDLIVDDLGSGYTKRDGFVQSCVEEIFIHRQEHQYPVVATTNLTPAQFRREFGERVWDRLRGPWGIWINVGRGPSLRKKPAGRRP